MFAKSNTELLIHDHKGTERVGIEILSKHYDR